MKQIVLTKVSPERLLQKAREAIARGPSPESEAACRTLLERMPNNPEALNFLAACKMLRGETLGAISLLERAEKAAPNQVSILFNFALAVDAIGNSQLAIEKYQRALKIAPQFFEARLHMAAAYHRLGDQMAALIHFFGAINAAQAAGHWLDPDSISELDREHVLLGMSVVTKGRRALFNETLAPLKARYGADEMRRIDKALAVYLLDQPAEYDDPRQRPSFFYVPGMPASPYLDTSLFPWKDQLEAATSDLKEELHDAMARGQRHIEPVHKTRSAAELDAYLYNPNSNPRWDGIFFFRHGKRYDTNHARCPRTSQLLDSLPLVKIRDHSPETLFSFLTPGSQIRPHRGVTNTRIVVHLPLIVPENCALSVAGELHVWQEGRSVMFDDTYEHEAWNRGGSNRVILICDVWNPHLTEGERAAVTDLVESIGEFNRACGL